MQVSAPSNTADLVQFGALLINAFGLVVIVGSAWKLSSLLAQLGTKMDFLGKLPENIKTVENRVTVLERDLNALAAVMREGFSQLKEQRKEDMDREAERLEQIVTMWEERRRP